MSDRDFVHTIVCNYKQDFKGETIAAELADDGVDSEQILILMTGGLTRPFSADVKEIENGLSDNHRDHTLIKTSREGIYDMLPQGLFHEPALQKSARSEQEIILAMKARRLEELNARRFFIPFEATINTLRLELAIHENHLDKRSHYDDLALIFADEWEIFKYLDARQANIFLHIIPIIHDIRDDHAMIKEVMEMIFQTSVDIRVSTVCLPRTANRGSSILGDTFLGISATTGKTEVDEEVDQIAITVGPMEAVMHLAFIKHERSRMIFDMLCDYFLPVDNEIKLEFQLHSGSRQHQLSDHNQMAMLGNLYL